MPNNIPNSTDYEHPNEPNLVNLHKALEYNQNGEPHLRVKVDAGTVTVTEIDLGVVEISNDEGNPIPVHAHLYDENDNEYTASNPLTIDGTVTIQDGGNSISIDDGGNVITVDGTVNVGNFPATQTVDGTVTIQDGGNSITVDGSVSATVSGTVSVDNFPSTQTVDGTVTIQDGGNSITVDGNVSVGNFPASQTVDGTVNIGTMPNVTINQPVAVTDNGGSITVDGNVNATVSGTVSVDNFPATQTVDGTVTIQDGGNSITVDGNVNATVSGTVSVDNFPASQTVDGTVTIQDGGNVITVDGSVSVDNFPATQTVDGTVELGTTSLSALENINANVTGTVNIGTMPNVTINQPVAVTDNDGSLTVDGTVDIGNEVAINDGGNSITVDGTVNATLTGSSTFTLPSTQSDAFGRLRVSEPFTLFDSSLRYQDNEDKWDTATSGSGSTTHLPNESSLEMSVTGNGDEVIRETKRVFSYQPGKGLLVLSTFVMDQAQTGLRQRVGYFGAENGIYFEQDGEELYLVIRKHISGSVDDTSERIPQSSWNTDTMDGNGASGITLDINKAQIWWCDIEWLGVGSVRAGFVINGQFVVCHIFHHANILDSVYMTTATLPCRYEITSTGASASMKQICSSVMSEGGYTNKSIGHTASTALAGKALSQTVYRPLVCIRLKGTRLDSVVVPTKYDLLGLQQAAFKYAVIINPTLTGANWTSTDDDSAVEYDVSATALTGGHIIDSGIFVGSNKGGAASISGTTVDFSQQLGRTIAGVSDIFCLAAIATSNNDDAVGSLTWQEHR